MNTATPSAPRPTESALFLSPPASVLVAGTAMLVGKRQTAFISHHAECGGLVATNTYELVADEAARVTVRSHDRGDVRARCQGAVLFIREDGNMFATGPGWLISDVAVSS